MKAADKFLGPLTVWIPLTCLVGLILFSALVLFSVSLSETAIDLPPFAPVIDWARWDSISQGLSLLDFDTYAGLSDRAALYLVSLRIAGLATLTCLVAGFPIAIAMARVSKNWRPTLVCLLVLLIFTAIVVRIYAVLGIVRPDGLLPIANAELTIYLGIVHAYLPLMILPLFSSLIRVDPALFEAATDLGCSRLKTFWTITLPLCLPGIMTGCLLVFIPALGEFMIPDLLGGPEQQMVGQAIWANYFTARDWPMAATFAIIVLLVLTVPLVVLARVQERQWEAEG